MATTLICQSVLQLVLLERVNGKFKMINYRIWLSIFLTVCYYFDHCNTSRVLELTDRFLEQRKDGVWLVKFYAPWCGHCKRLEPIWSHVAQSLHDTDIRVARVDCTRFVGVATEFGVAGFPTIMLIKGYTKSEFRGERNREEIVAFAKRMSGPPVKSLSSAGSFQYAKDTETTFFVYAGAKEGSLWECFTSVASELQPHVLFYSTRAEDIDQHVKLKTTPGIILYKENTIHHFTGHEGLDEASDMNSTLANWVSKERFDTYTKITRGNFNQVLKSGKYIVLVVLEEDKLQEITPEMERFRNVVFSVMEKKRNIYHENFLFGWVGTPDLANSVAMETLPIPSLLIVNSTNYHHHIPQDDPSQLTAEAIAVFLDLIFNNSVRAYGGDNLPIRIYRTYYEAKTSLFDMWRGNPVLTAVLFGLPMGFLSLICYSICCADIMEASEEDDEADDIPHEKND